MPCRSIGLPLYADRRSEAAPDRIDGFPGEEHQPLLQGQWGPGLVAAAMTWHQCITSSFTALDQS